MIHPQIGQEVPNKEVGPAKSLADGEENRSGDKQSNIAQHDQLGILLLVQRARRVKMIDTTAEAVPFAFTSTLALPFVEVVASRISYEIHGPAAELLPDQVNDRGNWRLLCELVHLVQNISISRGKILFCFRHKHHVPLHVARGFVVLAMRDFPGEVGHKQSRVAYPAHSVIQDLAWGERLMSAFVGKHPKSSCE